MLCTEKGFTVQAQHCYQPCTQRNIFGSHWLLNVQTLIARPGQTFLKTSIILYRFCLSVLKHCWQVSPPFTCLTIITIFALLSSPPPKIKDCCRFTFWHLSGKLINAAVAVKTLPSCALNIHEPKASCYCTSVYRPTLLPCTVHVSWRKIIRLASLILKYVALFFKSRPSKWS